MLQGAWDRLPGAQVHPRVPVWEGRRLVMEAAMQPAVPSRREVSARPVARHLQAVKREMR